MTHELKITRGESEIALKIALDLEEFTEPVNLNTFHNRLTQKNAIVLVIYDNDCPAGFKIGYERNDQFYSWLGGVNKDFRGRGHAKRLLLEMESYAREIGYERLWMKTRNRFESMLHFALKSGFRIIDLEKEGSVLDYRIVLDKKL